MKELVKNVPEYAKSKPVWIVSECDDGLWFYGAWPMEQRDKANEIAMELGKIVIVE